MKTVKSLSLLTSSIFIFLYSSVYGQIGFIDHTISTSVNGGRTAFAVDIDGDNDVDVISSSSYDDKVAWYENDGSQNFTQHVLSTNSEGAKFAYGVDLDSDNDIDIIAVSSVDDKIAWFENDGSQNFTEQIITLSSDYPNMVKTIDMDGDNDVDIVAASADDNKIAWLENDGNQNFTPHIISSNASSASGVFAIDVDGDSDVDVLSSSINDDKIAWYENNGSQVFTEHLISSNADGAQNVVAIDVDGDMDIDVVSSSTVDDKIAWYENDGNENFTENVISTNADGALVAIAEDLDSDGDIDVLSASYADNKIAWYENDGNENFTENVITTSAAQPHGISTFDVDGDTKIDVLSASLVNDRIAWYEQCNHTYKTLTVSSCDSYTSPSGSNTWTTSGTYMDIIPNQEGCDSILTINLTINTQATGTDVISACNSYTWIDGNTYTTSNSSATHNIVGGAVSGCDSLVTLDLTINNVSDITTTTVGETITANNSSATYQWLDCDNNYSEINGATSVSFSPIQNGNYAVELTENNCVDTSDCVTITTVGIIENSFEDNLLVYPNPTSGNFSIDLGAEYESIVISIADISGKLIDSGFLNQSQLLNLSISEPAGIYIVTVQAGEEKAVIRLLKE